MRSYIDNEKLKTISDCLSLLAKIKETIEEIKFQLEYDPVAMIHGVTLPEKHWLSFRNNAGLLNTALLYCARRKRKEI
ncbi:TPA: hypothetical protein ACV75N_000278 [Escherichia coli]